MLKKNRATPINDVDTFMLERHSQAVRAAEGSAHDVDAFMAVRGGLSARQEAFWRFTDLLKQYAKQRIKLGIH